MSNRSPISRRVHPGSYLRFPALVLSCVSFLSILFVTSAVAQTVTITSPAPNSTVSSSVHIQAKATSTSSISISKIYLDGSIVYQVRSATVDTTLSLSRGTHRLTVWAYDAAGKTMQKTVYVTSSAIGASPSLTVFSRIEEQTDWKTCGNCGNTAATGATASYTMTRGITNPTTDGSSTEFWIGGNYPYKNGYWYIHQTAPTAPVQYLKYEFDLYVPKAYATAPQAIEFECQQKVGGYIYNFAWQANYPGKAWRIFDYVNRKWDPSGLSFGGFTPDTWHHVVAEYHIDGHYVVHDALTIDGVRKVVSKRHAAKPATTGRYLTNAFQLDLNGKAPDYKVYVDGMRISYR